MSWRLSMMSKAAPPCIFPEDHCLRRENLEILDIPCPHQCPSHFLTPTPAQIKDGNVPESKENTPPKSQQSSPTAQGQFPDNLSIPLSCCCQEKAGYLDLYLDTVPGSSSRHPLIGLKLVGHLINLKLPSQTLWQLAGRSIFCLTCQISNEKDWISQLGMLSLSRKVSTCHSHLSFSGLG